MLPYRLARQAGLAMAPAEQGWRLWLRRDADSDQLQELLRVHGRPVVLEYLEPAAFDERLGQLYEAGAGATEALIEGIGEQVDLDSLPRALSAMLVSRIKVMARLDIAEKRQPQDGRITLRAAGREVDVRVSTLPGIHGERVVMRVLDKQASLLALANLGMPAAVLQGLRSCLARPNGIVLSTGPTGSGKTTTLYASLNSLNDGSRNILTVEDPVEYAIAGIGQTAINPRAGLTFASGLRAILRQDPDVIMLGEIRDQETAQIAVQASLTGHLVLSTLHTNSAVGAVTRLRDMGIEPFLIASCLRGVLAQRLVRRLCQCAVAQPLQAAERALWPELAALHSSYHAVGCAQCQGSGYVGRLGLYEFIELDAGLVGLLYDGASELAMQGYLAERRQSLVAMASDCLARGETSLAEVLRVVQG